MGFLPESKMNRFVYLLTLSINSLASWVVFPPESYSNVGVRVNFGLFAFKYEVYIARIEIDNITISKVGIRYFLTCLRPLMLKP